MANFNSKIINLAVFSPRWYSRVHVTEFRFSHFHHSSLTQVSPAKHRHRFHPQVSSSSIEIPSLLLTQHRIALSIDSANSSRYRPVDVRPLLAVPLASTCSLSQVADSVSASSRMWLPIMFTVGSFVSPICFPFGATSHFQTCTCRSKPRSCPPKNRTFSSVCLTMMRRAMDFRLRIRRTANGGCLLGKSDAQVPLSPTVSCLQVSNTPPLPFTTVVSCRLQPLAFAPPKLPNTWLVGQVRSDSVPRTRTPSKIISNKLQLAASLPGHKTCAT